MTQRRKGSNIETTNGNGFFFFLYNLRKLLKPYIISIKRLFWVNELIQQLEAKIMWYFEIPKQTVLNRNDELFMK